MQKMNRRAGTKSGRQRPAEAATGQAELSNPDTPIDAADGPGAPSEGRDEMLRSLGITLLPSSGRVITFVGSGDGSFVHELWKQQQRAKQQKP
jgi:hypothetical protein